MARTRTWAEYAQHCKGDQRGLLRRGRPDQPRIAIAPALLMAGSDVIIVAAMPIERGMFAHAMHAMKDVVISTDASTTR